MGPVAEECVNLINELDTSLNTIGENFKTIADFLTTASATYKNADSEANQAVQLKLNGVSQTGDGDLRRGRLWRDKCKVGEGAVP